MEMDEFEAPDQFEFDLSDVAAFESVATEDQEQQISNQQQQLQQQLEPQPQPQDEEQQQHQQMQIQMQHQVPMEHDQLHQLQDDQQQQQQHHHHHQQQQQQQQQQQHISIPGSPSSSHHQLQPPQTSQPHLHSLEPQSLQLHQQPSSQNSQPDHQQPPQSQQPPQRTIQVQSQVLSQQQQQYVTGKILLIPINAKPGQKGVQHYLQLPAGTSPLAAMSSNTSSSSHNISQKKQETVTVERNKDSSYSYSYPYSMASSTPATPAPPTSTPPTMPVTTGPSTAATPSAQMPSSKRKPCNCTKSQCLKLYCDCFANGEFCSGCNCTNCSNSLPKEKERQRAILQCLERNPEAFRPKIGKAVRTSIERRHTKGCNCKRSGCLKNYCECYEAKILCSNLCKCCGCKNYDESFERKSLMQLANSATDNARGILKNLLPTNQTNHLGSSRDTSIKNCFINDKIIRASLTCLLQSAQQAEKDGISEDEIQNLLQIEMGKCLRMIVDSATEPTTTNHQAKKR